MQRDIHATPAYGRDYKSKAAMLADWEAGKDFRDAVTGQYLSKRDADESNLTVWVRYNNLRQIAKVR